jgi:lipopolysaccharide/colanic/teichoic acid biosynthesis glycosyltransferase
MNIDYLKNMPTTIAAKPNSSGSLKELLFLGSNDFLFSEKLPAQMKKNFPITTTVANDTEGALNWLNNKVTTNSILPIAIICEYEFLEKSDYHILNTVKSNDYLKTIPFIVVAGSATFINKKLAIEKGIDDLYIAPFQLRDMYDRIDLLNQLNLVKGNVSLPDEADEAFNSNIPIFKRLFDIAVSLAAIILLSPFFVLIACLIKLESRGPVVYSSKRVGTGYAIFNFYKFRSMYSDADQRLNEVMHLNQYDNTNDDEPTQADDSSLVNPNPSPSFIKISNDPRITRIGRLIRKTSLDELPQLFNVLKGDMSIVGNRPLPLYEAEQLTRDVWAMRFLAPAGITGLWQVSKRGKKEMSAEERIELDNAYAGKYSLWFDLKIMLKTIPAMLQHENV